MTTTEKQRSTPSNDSSERMLEDAFSQLDSELLGTLFHLLGNLEDARDALQDGFVRCWKNRDQLDEIANLRAWIFRVVYNVGVDSLKSGWRRRRKAVDVEALAPFSRENLPEETLLENERVVFLRDAIQKLDVREREIFLLRQNGALTYEQIAQTIDVPVGTVKTKMRRALAKLRDAAQRSANEARRRVAEKAEKAEKTKETKKTEKNVENPVAANDATATATDAEANRETKR